ncbi:MAG: GNAT family N-acetyltransferase [Chloroflexota bacterium]
MPNNDVCQFLPWDTDFFGFRVARVCENTLTAQTLQQAGEFCRRNEIRCLYFLAGIEDPTTTGLAEAHGFHYADIRVTFEHKLPFKGHTFEHTDGVALRPAKPVDIPTLVEIARDSYVASRFYYDPNFSRLASGHLYETWIKVSCEGYAQTVWVAEVDGEAVGYITCHVDETPRRGRIGLVGVGSKAQGRGIGKLLVQRGLAWFSEQGLPLATVVTQGRNIQAQRLYQRCGFVTQALQLWYHKWYPEEDKPES